MRTPNPKKYKRSIFGQNNIFYKKLHTDFTLCYIIIFFVLSSFLSVGTIILR